MLIIGGRFCCNIVQEVMNLKDRHKRFCKTLILNELNHISYNQMVDLISLLSIIGHIFRHLWSYCSYIMFTCVLSAQCCSVHIAHSHLAI